MTKMKTLISLLCFFLLVACATPRTTTPEERAEIGTLITTAETAIVTLRATNKISEEDYQLSLTQILELRAMLRESEQTPISVSDLLQQATSLSVRWIVQQQK